MKTQIVYFDSDGVLTFGNQWVKLHKATNLSQELEKSWFDQYHLGKITFAQWNQLVEDYYKKIGLTKNKFEEVLDLKNYVLNEEAKDLIEFLKQKKIPTAIISGGIDYHIKKVAEYFGIDAWYANTSFEFNESGLVSRLAFFGEATVEKIIAIKNIAFKLNLSTDNSIYVGDSTNDLKAFEYTKRGVLYETKQEGNVRDFWTPLDEKLIQAAWKKVTDLRDIKTIIDSENNSS
jgi:HAD superfamily phosphoserine phosphatase-like hydrolase